MNKIEEFAKFLEDQSGTNPDDLKEIKVKNQLQLIRKQLSYMEELEYESQTNEFKKVEHIIEENINELYKSLKMSLDKLTLLGLVVFNSNIESKDLNECLKIYCSAIFQCPMISVIGDDHPACKDLNKINEYELKDEEELKKLREELAAISAEKTFSNLNLSETPILSKHLDSKIYPQNTLMKLKDEKYTFYVILHYNTESFIRELFNSNFESRYKPLLEFIINLLAWVVEDILKYKNELAVKKISQIKLSIIFIYKQYFLTYVNNRLRQFMEYDM